MYTNRADPIRVRPIAYARSAGSPLVTAVDVTVMHVRGDHCPPIFGTTPFAVLTLPVSVSMTLTVYVPSLNTFGR